MNHPLEAGKEGDAASAKGRPIPDDLLGDISPPPAHGGTGEDVPTVRKSAACFPNTADDLRKQLPGKCFPRGPVRLRRRAVSHSEVIKELTKLSLKEME